MAITPLDKAAAFDVSELFFSTTDKKGHVSACNDVFLRIAGYEPEEMLGANHNIIRHPDMPKCVFKLLWDYLHAGRPVGAYVKNITKTGEYYWVFALVFPIGDEYLSIRLKPTTETLGVVQGVYAQLLATEQSHGKKWREGMAASGEQLMGVLSSIGFGNYDDFAVHCLRGEISARDAIIKRRSTSDSPLRNDPLEKIFNELTMLDSLKQEAHEQASFLTKVGSQISRITLNSSISAAKMGQRGLPLGVVSDQAASISRDISVEAEALIQERVKLVASLAATSFQISFSTLTAEMQRLYLSQIASCELTQKEQADSFGATGEDLSKLLTTALRDLQEQSARGTTSLIESLDSFERIVARFDRILLATRVNHITGRSIAASFHDGEQYSSLLDEMAGHAEGGRDKLESLREAVEGVSHAVHSWDLKPSAA